MLEARGLGVDTVASGREALDYLTGQAPDVIFMDYMMADLDGYEVTAMIRRNPRTSTIPVFMCTANDTPQEQLRAHECGANGFVRKPFADAALDALLTELRASAAAVPSAARTSIPVAEIAAPAAAEDTARVAERVAHDVAERLVHEAIAALSATSEQTVRSMAQTVAASATEDALASWRLELAKTNERAEHVAVPAAEQAAQAIVHRAAAGAEAARQVAEKAADEKLREALVSVQSTAERVARETIDSAKAAIEDASRQILDAARADLQESARIAAEAAAKPVAESAARAAIEQAVRETLVAAHEEEAASRSRMEQTTIAVAERVGRELVQLAFSAAAPKRQEAAGERIHAMESLQAQGEEPVDEHVGVAGAEAAESTFETREHPDSEPTETPSIATAEQGISRVARPTAWTVPWALLPWLAALTLAVLYLLVKSFL
jgi:CheY-like chemotaxis protein